MTPRLPKPWRLLRGLLAVVLGLAAALRLLEYLEGRPLWLDEAMLALNLGRHSFLALLGDLQYSQTAPPLFLWAIELASRIGGMGEYALRAVPLVAGLLVPWLIWRVGRELAGGDAALIAAALAAISVPLIRYSAEVKPYGIEVLVGVGLALMALRIRAGPERGARWWQLFGGGVAAIAVSYSAVFVLAGCLASLLADPAIRRDRTALRRLFLAGGGLAAGFAVLYLAFYLPHADMPFMLRYWHETFLDLRQPDFTRRLYGFARALSQPLPGLPDQLQIRGQSAAIALGLLLIVRRGGLPAAAQVVVPFAAFVAGALVTPYPIGERLQLFLAPFSMIAVAVLIAEALRLLRLRPNGVALAGVILVAAWGSPRVLAYRRMPTVVADSREPARLVSNAPDRDPVYVTPEAIPLWAFYSTDWSRPDTIRLDHFAFRDSMAFTANGRRELIGAWAGQVFTEARGYVRSAPEPGWAAGEADRIAAVARPGVWLFTTADNTSLPDSLRAEFVRRGMTVSEIRKGKKTSVLRVSVDSTRRAAPP